MSGPFSIPPRTVRPHSQLRDVTDPSWHLRSCGIACIKMVMEFLDSTQHVPSLDDLIVEGVAAGAYLPEKGWLHRGLATLATKHGFDATNYDWSALAPEEAFRDFLACLELYPVIASVTKEFSPSKDGHLVVVTGIQDDKVFVNDPFRENDTDMVYAVGLDFFLECWTQRIVFLGRPGDLPRDLATETR